MGRGPQLRGTRLAGSARGRAVTAALVAAAAQPGKPGARLGKTTGWIHRATLKAKGVRMLGGVEYLGVDDEGLRIRVDGSEQLLPVDHVVICAGQEPNRTLQAELQAVGINAQLIGGADVAAELDAKRAIDQGSRVAAAL